MPTMITLPRYRIEAGIENMRGLIDAVVDTGLDGIEFCAVCYTSDGHDSHCEVLPCEYWLADMEKETA